MCAYIELTRGQRALVDAADYEALSNIKWHAHRDINSGRYRAFRHLPLTGHKTEEMSYFLFGRREGYVLDHKNRDQLDYRRENLRWATRQQNCRNRIRRTGSLPGVWKNGPRFSSRITIEMGVRKFLGYFKTAEAAHQAYVEANKQHFGEFSPYNHV